MTRVTTVLGYMRKRTLAIGALLLWSLSSGLSTAGSPNEVPAIELPLPLKPYSDVSKVVDAATGVIKILGTAKFDDPVADSWIRKAPCDAPEMVSFYRGMTLMQAGYFTFINKMERGFESVDTPHPRYAEYVPLVTTRFGALLRPGRELLVGIWNQGKLSRLLSLVAATRQLPAEIKTDLAIYFRVLKELGERYYALKRRAPTDLARLNRRSTHLYSYERSEALEKAKPGDELSMKIAKASFPEHLYYKAYAREMRLLLNDNRDIGQEKVSECFDGGNFAAVRLGENDEIRYHPFGLYPASYMVGFWERRDFEGTSTLTRFAIDQLLSALK